MPEVQTSEPLAPEASGGAGGPARSRRQTVARWVTFSVLGVVALYAVLAGVSALRAPERLRVADLADVRRSFRAVGGSEASKRYADAVRALDKAEHSVMRLFPRYDDGELSTAADRFAALARDSADAGYAQEAALALGRIRMVQGQDDAARLALQSVAAHRGYRAPEAARLLDYLNAEATTPAE